MENWTERARRRMIDLDLVQSDLRQPLQVKSRSAVGHYLSGRRQLTPTQLWALAHTLRCSLDWLFTGIGPISVERDEPPGEPLTPDEQTLLERYRQMAPPEKTALQTVVNALALVTRMRRRKSAIATPPPNDAEG